jgi:16S rRNA (cytidine1402-2'-O)-methyltransferase
MPARGSAEGGGRGRGSRRSSSKRPGGEGDSSRPRPGGKRPTAPIRPEGGGKDEIRPGLYLVATPIGNAADITLRALALLAAADVIAAEDTRVTAKLLARHGIQRPLTAYHDHNAPRAGPALIRRLKEGEIVALVSDAGTPLISDPGYRLVQVALAEGIHVSALPGASSVLAALALAGLPTDRFHFAGFLASKQGPRRRQIETLAGTDATLVLFEAPRRLAAALADLADLLGPRPAAVARELTKRFEELRRDTLDGLARHYAEAGPPKGEVVVVIAPPDTVETAGSGDIDRALALALPELGVRRASEVVALASGRRRREVYERALRLARDR